MIKAVVLDFDDTLCLTEAACFEIENEVLVSMGRSPMPRELHIKNWGTPLFEAIKERSPGIDVVAFEAAYHPIIQRYTEEKQFDDVPSENLAALDLLIENGYEIMILTSRTEREAMHLLEPDHILTSRITHFYHKDRTKYHKPDPRVFDELLAENTLKPNEGIYVGDSIGDAVAAKTAGLHFIASLESGLRQRNDFPPHHVDIFIEKFSDLPQAVTRLAKT